VIRINLPITDTEGHYLHLKAITENDDRVAVAQGLRWKYDVATGRRVREVMVVKSIDIDEPVRTAYNQRTQFESVPHFMEGVQEVRQLDDKRLHWRANIGRKEEERDAEITEQDPDQRVAWTSTSDAPNAGLVTFHRLGKHQTCVTLQLDYDP
jgi:uncharacterized membrane protein